MIQKITGQNNNTPTKHLTHNNLKITDEKDIANHLAETSSQNSSAKYQSKSFPIIKTKAEKVKIKFQSKNTETYNQLFSIFDYNNNYIFNANFSMQIFKKNHFFKDLTIIVNIYLHTVI